MIYLYIVFGVLLVIVLGFLAFLFAPPKQVRRSELPTNDVSTHLIRQEQLDSAFKSGVKSNSSKEGSKDLIVGTYLGGTPLLLDEGPSVYIVCGRDSLVIKNENNSSEIRERFSDIDELEILGSGKVTSNAGVVGGGFGLEGFLKGVVLASAINTITSKTRNNTFLKVRSQNFEALFHILKQEPAHLRLLLSPVFRKIGKNCD